VTLLDPSLPPPLFVDDDIPRARRSDPVTSHIAADATQAGLKEAKLRVLTLVAQHQPVAGSHLNDLYRLHGSRMNWKRLAFDSPRKRAGELAADGYLEVAEYAVADGNNLPEAIYRISDKGRTAIGVRS
jgi:hypothetical protein